MDRDLAAGSAVVGEPHDAAAAFRADPGDWLPLPARRRGLGSWAVTLYGPVMARQVTCRVGDPWVTAKGVWRTVRWRPEGEREDPLPLERLLPTFHGEVGIEFDTGTVRVRGRYRPPGGTVGRLIDGSLQHVAARTARLFVEEIGVRLAAAGPAGQDSRSSLARRSAR